MATDQFTADESRKLAVLIARVWADPQLGKEYRRAPEAVIAGAGINLAGRNPPEIPEAPAELAAQGSVSSRMAADSASSISTVTCPCSACTASCHVATVDTATIARLADSPESRAAARKLTAGWNVKLP